MTIPDTSLTFFFRFSAFSRTFPCHFSMRHLFGDGMQGETPRTQPSRFSLCFSLTRAFFRFFEQVRDRNGVFSAPCSKRRFKCHEMRNLTGLFHITNYIVNCYFTSLTHHQCSTNHFSLIVLEVSRWASFRMQILFPFAR